jgi:lysophospholipase L1-like esterase
MNVNPKAIRILCYGDSNTWGYIPGSGDRFDPTVRWTGLLQKALGEQFEIIEEGLSSRTTILNDSKRAGKNGAEYLKPCLQTQYPLDIVIFNAWN